MTLTDKQEMFCREYLIDLNATQAAIRAGYSVKTANRTASENLSKPDIQIRISELMKERSDRLQIDADYVLNRLVEIDQMDVLDILHDDGGIKPIHEWPKVWRISLSGMDLAEMFESKDGERDLVGILKKIKWPDKVKNLELLGKHISVQAFREQVKNEHDVVGTLSDLMDELSSK
ncbi:terminase small subunit [Morganella morganii]|uniref:terminase small subunit n=1 Tax=Morganella morganii TaxID=582 RepID=UPI0013974EF2|nr:terminase small subunit [Morganella morganii]MBC3968001.1 terminase small subunit [Morganella morganii]QHW20234.1 terminase small subunit [Morganella morganii]QPJ67574.1 terminase small subunit [Morganella morganii]HCQ8179607.1 terminase small subunit [Morganella morganii]